ncbi:MAG: ATP-dependent DNA helicase RecG, partial [Dehalococcoidia bacterium]
FEKLQKILELERSRNYTDSAVSGGLDKFLTRFSEAFPHKIRLPRPDYRTLDPNEREEWVTALLKGLSQPKDTNKKSASTPPAESLDSQITQVKGINTRLASRFHKLGVHTIRDLLYFFPRRHIDYSSPTPVAELEIDVDQTILVQVWQATARKSRRGMSVVEVIVGDDTGTMKVTFFNQPYLARKFTPNTRLLLTGKAGLWKGNRIFQPTSYELVDEESALQTAQLIPVYPLTEGLYPRQVRRVIKYALDNYLSRLDDFLPQAVRNNADLMPVTEAILQTHYPESESARLAARRRLAFDELFLIQVGVLLKRRERQESVTGIRIKTAQKQVRRFMDALPFRLTGAQKRALEEIRNDIARGTPMSRLLHGDVGSGKTVVATAAMLMSVESGTQAALMAPTEILAEQHFHNICALLGDREGEGDLRQFDSVAGRPVTAGLLTGSIRQKGKTSLYGKAGMGEVDIIVGTQALIQKKVSFKKLGLVVVDEQHRFGVVQRLALKQKGVSPHMLAMSATPIPRTLAMTLYGDLDISRIDEVPPGRKPVKTRWLGPGQRGEGYDFLRRQIEGGRQAYIICPLVEESESLEVRAATAEYERLSREIYPDLRVGLLHGRMHPSEKDEVMERFRAGDIDVLVSTSVVEVGVDVPNATVILIEGAERFGLSQLHQFRGRVWRSSHQAFCILMAENPSEEGMERLRTMVSTDDGFKLAEKDLEMRGPGEFFGTRQSGLPDLKMARLTDIPLLEVARGEALRLFEADPGLASPEHRLLAEEVARLWRRDE